VGLLSKYFTNHTIGSLYRGLISQLDRSRFHVTVFSVGVHGEAMADVIRRSADQMVLLSEHIPSSAAAVAAQRLDVLFYPELGMDPTTWSLAFQRLATVQCVSWGHPVTTGIPTIDWFISSELLEPDAAAEHYSERLALFETLPVFHHRSVPAGPARDRASFGLPTTGPLFVCPQSLFKLHPDFDPLLRRILESTPDSHLAVIEGAQAPWTDMLRQRWKRTLGPVFDRVHWLPRQPQNDFLHLIAASDVMLDPVHFGGGHTTYQGISLGTPIVTLPGRFMRGRATAACYARMGLTGLTAMDGDDYVRIAVELGTNRDRLAVVRQSLIQSGDAIFRDRTAVREFEAFFLSAVEQSENR
jgi:predicted O-linked N-acetylglucosamine transferase (SPINDLY family)